MILLRSASRQLDAAPKAPASTLGKLPPPGPAWYPATMGLGIVGTLLQTHADVIPGAHILALVPFVLGWVVLVALTIGFIARIARSHHALLVTLREVGQAPMWGTVAMGFLAIGSATTTIVPAWWPSLAHTAWTVDAVLWVIGTSIGVVAGLGFAMRLIGADSGAPTTVWGLAVVGPMVSSTTGAALVPHISSPQGQVWMLVGTAACFFCSLFLGGIIFAVAYHHHWRIQPVPLAASCSAWIPLGMVGQSTAAAQAMATQSIPMVNPVTGAAVQDLANLYGYIMLGIGVPLIAWAVTITLRGFKGRMPFTPGWWALTFPLGTLALGAHLVGQGTGLALFGVLSVIATVALVGTVVLCLIATATALALRGMEF